MAFGTVLEQSWANVGSFSDPSWAEKSSKSIDVYHVFVKITFLKKIELKKATWTEHGSIWVPKRVQKGSQIGAKMESK